MVYDKFKGIEQQSMPLSRQQTLNDEESVAQANVVNCVDGKTPREHQIGWWYCFKS